MSDYRVMIVHKDGLEVRFRPGSQAEIDLVEFLAKGVASKLCWMVTRRTIEQGVGWFKNEYQVQRAIEHAFAEDDVKKAIEEALASGLYGLKSSVVP